MITISIDTTCEMKESFFVVQKDGRDSVSHLSRITFTPINLEGDNIGPASRNKGVDLQIKGDPELGTPSWNFSNLCILLDVSRKADVLVFLNPIEFHLFF